MNFCWVTLSVKDLETSLSFYEGLLGLSVSSKIKNGDFAMAMLGEENQPKIELIQGTDMHGDRIGSGISVGVMVESLDEVVKFLNEHHVVVTRGPFAPNPHIRFVFVSDPDGYDVQLVETK